MSESGFFDRYFINFDNDISRIFSENEILASLLGLSRRLSIEMQDKRFSVLHHKLRLDDIKLKGMGLGNAQKGFYDKIANYASYLFAFQQYFHSSYRARQGAVLENVINVGIKLAALDDYTVVAKREKRSTLASFFGLNTQLDMDVVIYSKRKKFIMPIQIRSRDDTGGTTAKASNVDYLSKILKHIGSGNILESWRKENKRALYVILVWEALKKSQARSMKKKIWHSLEQSLMQFDDTIVESEFIDQLDKGYEIPQTNITLRVIYGFPEFMDFLSIEFQSNEIVDILSKVWNSLENWDDLWLTYTIASLELPLLSTYGWTNLEIISDALKKVDIDISKEIGVEIIENSKEWAKSIAVHLRNEKFPSIISSMQERMNYIRDLILVVALKFVATKEDYRQMRKNHKMFLDSEFNFFQTEGVQ